jgi:hypothetical protein
MTPFQLSLMCQLAYYDFPEGPDALGRTAGELARDLLDTGGELPPYGRQPLDDILRDPVVASLVLIGREVQLKPPGFAGYAFASPEVGKVVALRATEAHTSLSGLIDWHDNFIAPLTGSAQYPSVERFVNRYPEGRLSITGHSKGGHNALYALAVASNQDAVCVCFDAQGFARCQLSDAQRDRLRRFAINYVTQNDPVGALLYHPEQRVFVQQSCEPAHALACMVFDASGYPIPARRPLWSYLVEALTTLLAARWGRDCAPGEAT